MRFSVNEIDGVKCPQRPSRFGFSRGWLAGLAAFAVALPASAEQTPATKQTPDPSDPIINLFLQKGFITESEASKAKAEMEAIRSTNAVQELPHEQASRWKLNEGVKKVQFYGDLRLRYEDRRSEDPAGGSIELQRFRYSVRLGLQGDLFDDFYYGLRVETAANPRSPWVTFGSSTSGTYQGPFGKSTATIAFSQLYAGWHPQDWVDITVGKMPNPLYTTPMVWDPDINPEGAAERFKYTIGAADVFANFGQFLYQDVNPSSASGGLGFNGLTGQHADNIFQLAFQAGLNYHITTNITFKAAPALYKYIGLHRSSVTSPNVNSPFFGDPYIGEGTYLGPGTGTTLGASGFGTSSTLPGYGSLNFPLNQVGIDNLLVVDVPFELDFKIHHLDARVFGDASYNLEGADRAKAAAAGYANWLASQATPPTISGFSPQKNEDKAWQLGLAIGNEGGWSGKSRHPWEFKTYWEHTEQYALDPNLIDSDVFEGRENMEGINVQLAYGFTKNVIGTVRYAHGDRINNKLGTGGSNQDIPQMNPIAHYDLLQLDLTLKY